MLDQADHLRQLIRGAAGARERGGARRPRMLVLAGGKGGVGTTTIAVNLAVATARHGRRTLLVDGDIGKADAAALCGMRAGYTIADVLARRHSVDEVSQPGPAGTQVLPGAWATGLMADCDVTAHQRLIAELAGLGHVDQIIVDAGCGVHRVLEHFWKSADQVLLVSSPDSTSVMDAYATLKTLASRYREVPVEVVVNMAAGQEEARDAHARLAVACRRFLAIELPCVASIARSTEIAAAARRRTPFLLASPKCQAAQIIEQLAVSLCSVNIPGENHESEQTIQAAHT